MFLDCFKDRIISRGLDYYFNENVRNVKMIEPDVFSGIVEGHENYNVTIDVENAYNSKCSCPYGDLCKHMVALYFEAFPDMTQRYSYYSDEDDYDDEWNEYEDEWDYDYRFIEPVKYKETLDRFINSLTEEECRVNIPELESHFVR